MLLCSLNFLVIHRPYHLQKALLSVCHSKVYGQLLVQFLQVLKSPYCRNRVHPLPFCKRSKLLLKSCTLLSTDALCFYWLQVNPPNECFWALWTFCPSIVLVRFLCQYIDSLTSMESITLFTELVSPTPPNYTTCEGSSLRQFWSTNCLEGIILYIPPYFFWIIHVDFVIHHSS